jgi:hypothetical protein
LPNIFPVSLEVELEVVLRPRPAVERRQDVPADRPDRPVDSLEGGRSRAVELRYLVRDRLVAAGPFSHDPRLGPDGRRARGEDDLGALDRVLPLALPVELREVVEHLLRRAVDLDAGGDRSHVNLLLGGEPR